MAFSSYKVLEIFKDPSKGQIIRPDGSFVLINSNRTNIAILEFPNDDGISPTIVYWTNGDNLTNESIENQARNIIVSLNAQEASLSAITVGILITPKPLDPKIQALLDAQITFGKASQLAMVKFRNDPDELTAYTNLVAAQDALTKP